MAKQHLKRINSPKTWGITKKGNKFVVRSNPGAHPMDLGLPLNIILKDRLNYAKTRKEVVKSLHNTVIKVNQKRRKDHKFCVGVMDTLSLETLNEHYRIMVNQQGKFCLVKTDEKGAKIRPAKLVGKTNLKKGKIQLNLGDGTNINVEKDEYTVGDSIILEYPNKIINHFKIAPGSYVYFTKGKQVGKSGIIENVSKDKIIFKMEDGKKQETSKKYAFVVGKDASLIVLPG